MDQHLGYSILLWDQQDPLYHLIENWFLADLAGFHRTVLKKIYYKTTTHSVKVKVPAIKVGLFVPQNFLFWNRSPPFIRFQAGTFSYISTFRCLLSCSNRFYTLVSLNLGRHKIGNFGKFWKFPWPDFATKLGFSNFLWTILYLNLVCRLSVQILHRNYKSHDFQQQKQ